MGLKIFDFCSDPAGEVFKSSIFESKKFARPSAAQKTKTNKGEEGGGDGGGWCLRCKVESGGTRCSNLCEGAMRK